jgi:cupin superfamily acireductone dioxygenase involved in methionine salvage
MSNRDIPTGQESSRSARILDASGGRGKSPRSTGSVQAFKAPAVARGRVSSGTARCSVEATNRERRPCTIGELADEGILVGQVPVAELDAAVARLMKERGAPREEPLLLWRDDPAGEAARANESDEHAHYGPEIRIVLEGRAVYEIRDRSDAWCIELKLDPGEWVVVPPERYHRFLVGAERVHCRQLFAELRTLMPFFRASHDETRTV